MNPLSHLDLVMRITSQANLLLSVLFGGVALSSFSAATPQSRQEVSAPHGLIEVDHQSGPKRERFAAVASERLGVAREALEIEEMEGPITLPDLGLSLYIRSVHIPEGERAVVALDANGNEYDLAEVMAQDSQLAKSRRGKLTLRLDEELRKVTGEKLQVMAWLTAPNVDELRLAHTEVLKDAEDTGEITREFVEHHEADLTRQITERISPVTDAFAERMRAAGREVVGTDGLVPVVFLNVDAAEIDAMRFDPAVLSLDYAGTEYKERIDGAMREVRANSVHSWGTSGNGVRVGIVEGGRVCTGNSNLPVSGTKNPSGYTTAHVTGVASCVRSGLWSNKGVAPGSRIYSANGAGYLSTTASAINWAVSQGCRIMNLSFGALNPGPTVTAFDRYLDSVVRSTGRTLTLAAGNSGSYAGDPGAGYNAIAVGNFSDGGSASWGGEWMSSSSSWRNPNTGVETPQVAAPGVALNMLSCDGGSNYNASGTSFSAPVVAGIAALMIDKKPALGSWSEAVRAIMMVTAWHNIEGAKALSAKDGAGGVDGRAAWRVAARGVSSHKYGVLYNSSFSGNTFVGLRSYATAGKKVRCALSWDSTPSGGAGYNVDQLKADFDLWIYRPDGAICAYSSKALQPFEIVEFTAPQSGFYTLKIVKRQFHGTHEYYGIAMSTEWDA